MHFKTNSETIFEKRNNYLEIRDNRVKSIRLDCLRGYYLTKTPKIDWFQFSWSVSKPPLMNMTSSYRSLGAVFTVERIIGITVTAIE